MSGLSHQDGDEQIVGGTDGTIIGNVGDRLKVDTGNGGGGSPIPTPNVLPTMQFLKDSGGNFSMDENGSSVPIVFFFAPATSEQWLITGIRFMFNDLGIEFKDKFGDVSELTNGLLIEWNINGTKTEIANPKSNMQLLAYFGSDFNDGDTGNNMAAKNGGIYTGHIKFSIPGLLTDTDDIRATVRDNLNGLSELIIMIEASKVL